MHEINAATDAVHLLMAVALVYVWMGHTLLTLYGYECYVILWLNLN
jgi:hypothetical protein